MVIIRISKIVGDSFQPLIQRWCLGNGSVYDYQLTLWMLQSSLCISKLSGQYLNALYTGSNICVGPIVI